MFMSSRASPRRRSASVAPRSSAFTVGGDGSCIAAALAHGALNRDAHVRGASLRLRRQPSSAGVGELRRALRGRRRGRPRRVAATPRATPTLGVRCRRRSKARPYSPSRRGELVDRPAPSRSAFRSARRRAALRGTYFLVRRRLALGASWRRGRARHTTRATIRLVQLRQLVDGTSCQVSGACSPPRLDTSPSGPGDDGRGVEVDGAQIGVPAARLASALSTRRRADRERRPGEVSQHCSSSELREHAGPLRLR